MNDQATITRRNTVLGATSLARAVVIFAGRHVANVTKKIVVI